MENQSSFRQFKRGKSYEFGNNITAEENCREGRSDAHHWVYDEYWSHYYWVSGPNPVLLDSIFE